MNNKPSKENNVPFDISVWRRALIENRHAGERHRLRTVDKVLNAIEQLSHSYQWDDLYIFGSATKSERFGKVSDIDIGIAGLDKFLHYRFVADLSNLVEREVDVVRLEDCSFADTIRTRGIRWKKEK